MAFPVGTLRWSRLRIDADRDMGGFSLTNIGVLDSLSKRIGGVEVVNSERRLVGLDRVDQVITFSAPSEFFTASPFLAPLPLALFVYYNRNYLAFSEPDVIEYWDGTAWVAWVHPPNFKTLTDGRTTGVPISSTHRRFRLIYKAGVKGVPPYLSISGVSVTIISFGWGTVSVPGTITIESSGDNGLTWRTEATYRISETRCRWVYIPHREFYPNTWARYTFDLDIPVGGEVSLHHLMEITGRPDGIGGADLSSGFPFTWDTDGNSSLIGNLTVNADVLPRADNLGRVGLAARRFAEGHLASLLTDRLAARNVDNAHTDFQSRRTGVGLTSVARLIGAVEPRLGHTLPLNLRDAGTLTISAGAITIGTAAGAAWYKIDTEALAASDELDRINGGAAGDVIFLIPAHDTRTVVLRDYRTAGVVAGANIRMGGAGVTFSLDALGDVAGLLFDGTHWNMIARESNG